MQKGINIENVSFQYQDNQLLLKEINLHIPKGTFTGITGSNGSGKTTFSYLLNGLIPHSIQGKLKGDVYIDSINTRSKPVSYFAQKVGMVFQNPDFMLFNLSVEEEIAFGLQNYKLNNQPERIVKALKLVGLEGFEKRDPNSLSYGEKQKLTLACVLALDTEYIVLDEPAAMLDYRGALNLYQTLVKLNKEFGKTIIVIEHDTDYILTYTKNTIILNHGQVLLHDLSKKAFSDIKLLKHLGIKIPQLIK